MITPFAQDKPVFSYYGDDFTGSTDALEALASNGISTVLFLHPPTPDDLRNFPECRAVGIAGDSRSRSPEWMSATLPGVFRRLREMGAPLVQYKVCSTFDSSPETGSIGRAIEIGQEVFEVPTVPVVPAAPLLGRYVVFGNLFASSGDRVERIDRHPSMRQHPVTPMTESDLLVHLARQTGRRLALADILALRADGFSWPEADAVVFDGLEEGDLERTARLIWERRPKRQTLVVGSSGFTYGMMDLWRAQGWLTGGAHAISAASCSDRRLLVLAGSCSPTTEQQLRHALRDGFAGIRLNPANPEFPKAESDALTHLAAGRSVILYSALGPSDMVDLEDRNTFAAAMGKLLRHVTRASGVSRLVIAGGDTASHGVQEMGIFALTFAAPLVRGAPWCRAHGWPRELEIVLKGGQIGSERFFEDALSWQ